MSAEIAESANRDANTDADQPDVLAEARALAERFSAAGDEIEAARRVPKEHSDAMARAGIYRMFIPEAIGGLEVSPLVGSRVFETLAQGEASCGWVAFIGATSGTTLARVPEDVARECFPNPETLIAGVFAPNGRAERVEGGFQVNGRWQWGSGTENADWVLGGSLLKEGGEAMLDAHGNPRQHMMLFPASDIEFLDTWHVTGLKGTGSTDFQVTDCFVPEGRAVGFLQPKNPDRPLYQFPNFTFLALGIAAVTLGIARSAIDELVSLAQSKKRVGSGSTMAEKAHTQLEVAGAEANLRSARAFYYDAIEAAWTYAERGDKVPMELRRDLRLATNHAVSSSVKTVDAMYTLAGGSSVYSTSKLQRHFRDVHVATQHIMVGPNITELVGKLYLGVPANAAML
ncbi:MAG: acyl-CoA dehydrogenase family protein [Pseudomonadota bacterium]